MTSELAAPRVETAPVETSPMRPSRALQVNLQVGLVVIMLLVMLPLTIGMTGVLYRQNSELTIATATAAMDRVSADTVIAVRGLLDPISHSIDLGASLGRVQQQRLRRPENWQPLIDQLEHLPDVYSLYYGFTQDGGFLQVVRLSPRITTFGPENRPPPPDARYVVRSIDSAAGEPADSYIYYKKNGEIARVERAPAVGYDPRDRPWYKQALAADQVVNSGIYVFSGINRPGITLSRQVKTEDGVLIAVFGADLSTDALSAFLQSHKVGSRGITFLTNPQGELVGFPDSAKAVTLDHGKAVVTRAEQVSDPLVADAMQRYSAGAGARFSSANPTLHGMYMASFTPMQIAPGETWIVGVLVDEEEFVGPLRRASLIILITGLTVLVLASIGIIQVSRLVTRPVAALIRETQLIQRLELDDPVQVESRISEVADLANSLRRMKSALRSFGLFVPKELVREIVAHGGDTQLGAGQRQITVMFTDLADFTKTSEKLAPSDVLDRLSAYFEVMTHAIHTHNGTIDKFIGDAVMVLWNAPAIDPDQHANACLAALACCAAETVLNDQMRERGLPPFYTRLGIHAGDAVVGNVGSTQRLQYTALGAIVNLASRIEGLNKRFHSRILVTDQVANSCDDRFVFRPLGPVVAAGTSQAIELFELLGTVGATSAYPVGDAIEARLRGWVSALAAYRRHDWATARQGFLAYLTLAPQDGAATLLAENCARFIKAPPPSDWDGALTFESK